MDIAIDSNIIRRDFKFKDRNLAIVFDYLKRTQSRIVLPQIAFEESIGLYRKFLKERIEEFERSYEKLKATISENTVSRKDLIDLEKEVSDYEEYLLKKLKVNRNDIVKYKNEYLPELVTRAINRQKPLDTNGQQFRDGLLWLTLLDYANEVEGKTLIFVSDNTTDFADKATNELHADLVSDLRRKNVRIIYYNTLAEFVKGHAAKVDFLTEEWITANVDFERIETTFEEALSFDDRYILESVDLDRNESTTGSLNATSYIKSWLLEYYVYEMSDETLILNLEIEFEKEYEVEIEKEKDNHYSDYEYLYRTNPITGALELNQSFIPRYHSDKEYDYKYEYPLFRAKFALTIQDKQIVSYEYKEWDWG